MSTNPQDIVPNDVCEILWTPEQLLGVPKPIIKNVVGTFLMSNTALDPLKLSRMLSGITYNPKKFAACAARMKRCVILLFYRGSGVCGGASSVEEARLGSIEIANVLLKAGQLVQWRNFVVCNIVCRAACGFFIDLNAIAATFPMDCQYENSRFPGLIFRLKKPLVVFIIFVTGRCIITGAKTYRESELSWTWFYYNVLTRFRRHHTLSSSSSIYLYETMANDHTMTNASYRLFLSYVQGKQEAEAAVIETDDELLLFERDSGVLEHLQQPTLSVEDRIIQRLDHVSGPSDPEAMALLRSTAD